MGKMEEQDVERQLLLDLNAELTDIERETYPTNFAYFIGKNLGLLKPEIKAFEKACQEPKSMDEYNKSRAALAEQHAEKDARGKAKMIQKVENGKVLTHYDIKDIVAFDIAHGDVIQVHQAAFEEREAQLKEIEEMKEEKVKIALFKIKKSLLPEAIKPIITRLLAEANLIIETE